ncbi:MAG: ATP-binding cassette domain-containing protein [Flavobacteriaceae bacterium]|nr:ATP-binding cassette domain-containing protein [Flavobacteriaceae bacterium]
MIQLENLSKKYEEVTVLEVASLSISKGEHFGLVGNNGAGKTTLFSLLLDLIRPSSGKVSINKIEVAISEAWKKDTAAFIDDAFLIDYLTPEEYFAFVAQLRKVSTTELDVFLAQFEEFFNGEVLAQKKYIRDFSKGNQKKVGLAAAFIGKPEVVILDEPFANLDPSSQIRLKKFLTNDQNTDCTLLISSHDLNHVTDVCDRIVLLEKGSIIKDTPKSPETLKELEAYFSAQ